LQNYTNKMISSSLGLASRL